MRDDAGGGRGEHAPSDADGGGRCARGEPVGGACHVPTKWSQPGLKGSSSAKVVTECWKGKGNLEAQRVSTGRYGPSGISLPLFSRQDKAEEQQRPAPVVLPAWDRSKPALAGSKFGFFWAGEDLAI